MTKDDLIKKITEMSQEELRIFLSEKGDYHGKTAGRRHRRHGYGRSAFSDAAGESPLF